MKLHETSSIAPRLLKTKPAAAYLAMSEWRLRTLVGKGEIPYIPGGSQTAPWLFDLTDLDQWVEKQKITL